MRFNGFIKGLALVVLVLIFQATPLADYITLDLLYLFTVVLVLQWSVTGAITGGVACGLVACTIAPYSPVELAFFYALNGYIFALLADACDYRNVLQALKLSTLGACLYVITSNSLLFTMGLTEVRWWNLNSFLPHLVGILTILAAAHKLQSKSKTSFGDLR